MKAYVVALSVPEMHRFHGALRVIEDAATPSTASAVATVRRVTEAARMRSDVDLPRLTEDDA